MMETNVGTVDKAVRVVLGVALLSLLFVFDGTLRLVGLIGLVPLATALFGYCPLYTLLGVRTCAPSTPHA
jgi:hypothetical protein